MYRHSFIVHTLIQTCVTDRDGARMLTYYEVVGKVHNGYDLAVIDPNTGETNMGTCTAVDGQPLKGLGFVAPTHPVYQLWATRRLQDRLEGLERT